MQNNHKVLTISMLIGAAAALLLSAFGSFAEQCAGLRAEVLRLHILAASDSAEDQQLKYDLRDFLLADLNFSLADAYTIKEAKELTEQSLAETERKAVEFVRSQGYDYDVRIKLDKAYFTTRVYENITMPAGNYYALIVQIGAGEGENWWCVAFPPLCLPAGAKRSGEPAQPYFTPEAGRIIESGGRPEFRFAVYEWFAARFR